MHDGMPTPKYAPNIPDIINKTKKSDRPIKMNTDESNAPARIQYLRNVTRFLK